MRNLRSFVFLSVILCLTVLPATAQEKIIPVSETENQKTKTTEINLPEDTMVELRLSTGLQSNLIIEGQLISFSVVEPIKINDVIVIEGGARARGKVAKFRKAGSWGRGGEIFLEMQDVMAVDGSRIPLKLSRQTKATGDSDHAPAIARGGATVAVVALLGPVGVIYGAYSLVRSGLNKGSNAVIPEGLLLEAKVIGSAKVKVALTEPDKKQNEDSGNDEKITTEKNSLE